MKTTKSKTNIKTTVPVVLIRHAQSQWNLENRFTGWADPSLTKAGVAEAIHAGETLRSQGYRFDVAFRSRLQRAIVTLDILLQGIDQTEVPRFQDWRLNERHYGSLQGTDKAQATARVGAHQVWRWRRGYQERAEPLPVSDPGHPLNNPLYADVQPHRLPGAENLAQTRARVVEFWEEQIAPRTRQGQHVLISAHGNTLRALLMELAGMSIQEVEDFEIPTATPILYHFDDYARPVEWRYMEATAETAKSA